MAKPTDMDLPHDDSGEEDGYSQLAEREVCLLARIADVEAFRQRYGEELDKLHEELAQVRRLLSGGPLTVAEQTGECPKFDPNECPF